MRNYNLAVAMEWLCKAFRFEKRLVWRSTTAVALLVASATTVLMLGRVQGVGDVRNFGLRLDASPSLHEEVVGEQPDTFVGEGQANSRDFSAVSDHLARKRGESEFAVAVVRDADHRANGSDARLAKIEIEWELEDVQQQLAGERSARDEAQRDANEARERLTLAERAVETVHEQLAAEHNARLTAEIAAQNTRQRLGKEHGAIEAAEHRLKKAHHASAKHAVPRTWVDARSLLLLASPN